MDVKQILEEVAAGRMSIEEAHGRLAGDRQKEEQRQKGTPSFLKVDVDSAKGDRVDIRVPLKLVTAGMKVAAMIPEDASTKLRDKGIDLSQLSELQGEELVDALRELKVDVTSKDGDIVKIYCE